MNFSRFCCFVCFLTYAIAPTISQKMPPKEVLCGSLPPDNSVEFSFLKIDGMNLDSVARFISIEFFRKFGRFALIESLTTFCTFGIKFELSEDSLVTDGPWTNEVIASGRTFLINAGAATIDVLAIRLRGAQRYKALVQFELRKIRDIV
ncbi:hypothetical protein GQX74_007416 [Glossina fuscipes]|nr:hypothetical protein GQX74_007416 [Glossina fuscipes]